MKKISSFFILIGAVSLLMGITTMINRNQLTNIYTITFYTSGGTIIETKKVEKGSKLEVPEEPQKEGYRFLYWKLNGEEYDFEQEVEEDMNLIAVWSRE